jgi:hypothetical protein
MRIIDPTSQWSPYPDARVREEHVHTIPGDVFFPDAELPVSWLTEELAKLDADIATRSYRVRPSDADRALEIGIARTECVRELSDGIPIIIGTDESTKPVNPPKGSISYVDLITERGDYCREDCIGRCPGCARSSGVRW